MATAGREENPNLDNAMFTAGDLLESEPWRFTFFQAVRLLLRAVHQKVAAEAVVSNDFVRFAVHPSAAFAASEIQALTVASGMPAQMTVNFMGLVGPAGVLPLAFTHLVIEQVRSRRFALRDFLDIINHRLIAMHYAAWEKYRLPVALERRGDNGQMLMIRSLLGLGFPGLNHRVGREYTNNANPAIPDQALCYFSGLLSSHRASAVALEQCLSAYFAVEVDVEQFVGKWRRLGRDTQTRLGEQRSEWASLGQGVIGDEVQDASSLVRIRIGPLSLSRYVSFLPGGRALASLKGLVRLFSQELEFELQLVLSHSAALPGCTLGSKDPEGPRLGWLTWMPTACRQKDLCDTILPLSEPVRPC